MSEIEVAELTCSHCGRTVDHELHYSGRLLHSTHCTECGHVVVVESRELLPAYLRDLEQRVLSKPSRLARRAAREPREFFVSLPAAVIRQPIKIVREVWSVFRG